MIINYAHRGASGYYPENTMLAFEKAVELGCTGIETDVQMTKDGTLVLIHDERVNRTTNGTGFVMSYTIEEIQKLDAGSFMSEEFSHCSIPRLEDLLELVKPLDIMLNLEIKTGIVFYDDIENKIIDAVYKYGLEKRVILSSFNHYSMVDAKRQAPELKTALLYMEGLYKPEKYCLAVGADALHPNFYSVNPEMLMAAHNLGLIVNTYTVNEKKQMEKLISMSIDGIITNYPDVLNKVLEEMK